MRTAATASTFQPWKNWKPSSFGWPNTSFSVCGTANPPPAFARKAKWPVRPRLAREPQAPDQVDEDGIGAVVELVTQDIRRERDVGVDGRAVERAGHADRLILLDDPLDVVERQLDAPLLVEEDADPDVVLRDGQGVIEEVGPPLAVARLHADEREVVAERRLAEVHVALREAVAVVAPGDEELAAGRPVVRRRAARRSRLAG